MATGRAQEEQGVVTEESCTALSTASSSILSDDGPPRTILECHICLDVPTSPVASSCGHVFCWPCLNGWIENSVKPCPVCRELLTTTMNVLSLHHNARNDDTRARASDGNNDIANEAAPVENVIFARRQRPANPLLFVPRESGASPEFEVSESVAIARAIGALIHERSIGHRLASKRPQQKLELKKCDDALLQRTSDLKQDIERMGEHIAELQQRLALANQQLPSGWADRCHLPSETSASEPPSL